MGTTSGTILGQKFWNGGWIDYRSQAAYAGTNSNRCYTYILKFTVPDFVGVSESITFTLAIGKEVGDAPTLRYAVCGSDANLDRYVDTNAEVTDGNQLVSGTVTTPELSGYQSLNDWNFTIPVTGITTGGTYYLFLWGYAPKSDPEWVTVHQTSYHKISFAYNSGLAHIGSGSYVIYIGNGTSWEMYMPYIGNGTSWDVCS